MLRLEDIIKGKSKPADESRGLIRVHHTLMMNYGWIPIEEFKKLPMPTIMNLLKEIEKDNQDQKRQMEKSKFRR